MDINAILASLTGATQGVNQKLDSTQRTIEDSTIEQARAGVSMEQNIAESIKLAGQAAEQKAAVDYATNVTKQQATAIAGLNPDDLNNEFVQTMAQLTAIKSEKATTTARYRQMSETNLFDNPLQYIVNQLNLPQVASKMQNLETQEVDLATALQNRQTLLQQNHSAVAANTADALRAADLTKAKAVAMESQTALDRARIDNAGRIATGAMNEAAIADKRLGNAQAMFGSQMAVANYQTAQANLVEARAERAVAALERKKNKDEQLAADDIFTKQLLVLSKSLALPAGMELTPEAIKRMPASPAKTQLVQAAVMGTYGSNLPEAIKFLKESEALPNMQKDNQVYVKAVRDMDTGIKSYTQKAMAPSATNPAGMKPAEAAKAGGDNYLIAIETSAHNPAAVDSLTSPTWDTTFNPRRSQDLVMLDRVKSGMAPELANNVFVKHLSTIAATAAPGQRDLTGAQREQAIQAIAVAVKDRIISPAAAAKDVVAYNRAAAAYNYTSMKLGTLALPPQESAYVRVNSPSFLAPAVSGDLFSQSSTENLLVNLAISQARGMSRIPSFGGIDNVARKELTGVK